MAASPQQSTLIEEAAAWLTALDSGTADPAAFELWRASDPRHAVAFAQIASTWSQLDRLKYAPQPAKVDRPQSGLSRRAMLQAASVISVMAVGGGLASRAFARSSAETAIGEQRLVVLDDGSHLQLNTGTRAEWRFADNLRSVWLTRGEIAIDVAGDRREFELYGTATSSTLKPGSYNARLSGDVIDLLVMHGEAVSRLSNRVLAVQSGRSALLSVDKATVREAEPIALDRARSWRRGEVVFNGESLDFAVAEYNRYLTRPLVISDAQLSRLRLGGRFTSSNPHDFLQALQASFGIRPISDPSGSVFLIAAA